MSSELVSYFRTLIHNILKKKYFYDQIDFLKRTTFKFVSFLFYLRILILAFDIKYKLNFQNS